MYNIGIERLNVFEKFIFQSHRVYVAEELNNISDDYDCIIVGSDQYGINRSTERASLLSDFVDASVRKIAYAASFVTLCYMLIETIILHCYKDLLQFR